MTKIHEIDGKKYVEVGRQASSGDLVIIVDAYEHEDYNNGDIGTVVDDCISYRVQFNGFKSLVDECEYLVLEPIEEDRRCYVESSKPEPNVTDLIANLARRVSSLEHKCESLSDQLADTQRNVERQGYELAEANAKIEMLTHDIIMLDERTMTKQADVVTFDKFLDSVAEKVAERLVGR